MTRKLTRQERKEALRPYDILIAEFEAEYDKSQDDVYAQAVEGTQRDRAAELDRLEKQPDRDPWKST